MKRSSFSLARWAAALLLAFPLAVEAAAAQETAAGSCHAEVSPALQELGVQANDVHSVQVKRRSGAPNPPTNYVYDAWVRLESCDQGYLVITMTRYCHVKQSYTRGDCQVGGVARY
jgi:hypothetical protein